LGPNRIDLTPLDLVGSSPCFARFLKLVEDGMFLRCFASHFQLVVIPSTGTYFYPHATPPTSDFLPETLTADIPY